MSEDLVLVHDLGTTGAKTALFSSDGHLRRQVLRPYDTVYGPGGLVEQDAEHWWRAVQENTREIMAATSAQRIRAVGLSGHMMGGVPVDARLVPLRPAMIWADTRARPQAERLAKALGVEAVLRLSGSRPNPSYLGPKLRWLLDNEPGLMERAYKMLHPKDFVAARLTGEVATDYGDATGTNLFDLRARQWSDVLMNSLGVPQELLPPVHAATDVIGGVSAAVAREMGLVPGTPVVIGSGDGPCAGTGAGATRVGESHMYLGSSAWIAVTAAEPLVDRELRTFTMCSVDPRLYQPTGTMQAAGLSVKWMRDRFADPERDVEARTGVDAYGLLDLGAERIAPGADGVIFLPYLLGERSPWWDPHVRGSFLGLEAHHGPAQLFRAVLEGVAMNLRVILEAFQESGLRPRSLRVIGGGAKSMLWLRILASVLALPLEVLGEEIAITARGAAVAASVGVGLMPSVESSGSGVAVRAVVEPDPGWRDRYADLYPFFVRSYQALAPLYGELAARRGAGS